MSAPDDEQLYGEEDEEEMMTERDLADDAQWKLIQKNTFTRWANEHLKTVQKTLTDLEADLGDGLRLISLVEVLSGKKFKHVNKRPSFRTQKLENVTMVLEFLERDEGIRIVNIDSTDIVDCKLKLILGLIWTLILHYSISMPMWEGEEPTPSEGGPTPKQRLLNWINSKVPDLPIKNFTTDWNDGKAIGALVDAVAPGLCPDWDEWDPKKARQNAQEAMDAAEKWLDVPQLIKPDEMTNPKVDDLSMMTYLSQFPHAKLKPGAPLRPKQNASRVRAFGPGLEPKGNRVGAPAKFTVETFNAGQGSLEILVLNPKGKQEPCETVFNNDRNLTYSCTYVPSMEGNYKVIIKWSAKEISKSPFTVTVEGAMGDATKVTASGPGLEKNGVVVGKKTHFEVFTKGQASTQTKVAPGTGQASTQTKVAPGTGQAKVAPGSRPGLKSAPGLLPTKAAEDAGQGTVEVIIMDPSGHRDKVKPAIKSAGKDGVYLVEYTALEVGLHSISITFSGQQIPKSPYGVNVSPAINAKAAYAVGRGIQPKGVRVKDNADFKVFTKDAGKAELKVQIIGPGGVELKCTTKMSKTEEGVYECVYVPVQPGQYIINILFGEQHIAKSPFKVEVGPYKESKVIAYGPGLEGGVANQPAVFTVETRGEVGSLGFSIEGPSQAKIDCKDNGDGSADVTYWPTVPGEYAVHILCADEDIPKSPYMVPIGPETKEFDASKATAYGPGLEKTGVTVDAWAEFTVDTKKAGKAPLHITCFDVDLKPVSVEVKDNKNGTYSCRYMAKRAVKHTITITYGGVCIPNSPFKVLVSQASKPGNVKVFGPGVEKGVKTFVATYFKVDCKTAGAGDVAIALTDERGKDVPVTTKDNKDGTFTVEYTAETPGTYTVMVYFAGKEIPASPIKVKVESSIDVSKVKVTGLETPIKLGETRPIQINTSSSGKKDAPCRVMVTSPKGQTVELPSKPYKDGYNTEFAPVEAGPHKVNVNYGGQDLPKSPFPVNVIAEVAAEKVKVYGPGLEGGIATKPAIFTVDHSQVAPGKVAVVVDGPKLDLKPKVELKDNKNGTTDVTYFPRTPGDYKINVTYDSKAIPQSPIIAKITEIPALKVKAYGPGLEKGLANQPAKFTVDAKEAPVPGKVAVTVDGPVKPKVDIQENPNGTTDVTYYPTVPGDYKVGVTYSDEPIPKSPFTAKIAESPATKVKAYGPGLEKGVANKPAMFTIDTREATAPGSLGVTIDGPVEAKIDCKDNKNGTCDVTYYPVAPGDYTINVSYANEHIAKSPFTAKIAESPASRVKAYGPGLEKGVAKRPALFTIDTREATAPGSLGVTIDGPAETKIECKDNQNGTCDVTYYPVLPGDYTINVTYADEHISKSPFKATVDQSPASRVKAYGPGLDKGVANEPARFTIDTRETTMPGGLGVTVEGPVECKIECRDNQDGTCDVTYYPTAPGNYAVNVTYADEHIPKSPFTAKIEPSTKIDVSRVVAYGPGLEQKGVFIESPNVFTVDAKSVSPTGEGKVRAVVTSPSGQRTESIIQNKEDGTYDVMYTPYEQGPQKIDVTYEDIPIPQSPLMVNAVPGHDSSKVKAYGPGLEGGLTNKPQEFTIDVRGAGQGGLALAIDGPAEAKINCTDNRDGTCNVEYIPTKPGEYDVIVKFAEEPIPGSPFKVGIKNPVNPAKVQCYGPGLDTKGVKAGKPATFTVDTLEAGEAPLTVTYTDQNGAVRPAEVVPVTEGKFQATYYPVEEGKCKVNVKYANQEVPNSPFNVRILPGLDASKVRVDGDGVQPNVYASLPVTFVIDCSEAGMADIDVVIQRPDGTFIRPMVQDNGDGTFTVQYTPEDLGPYSIRIKFAGQDVPGSPFSVIAMPTGDATKCRIMDGLESTIPVNKETVITVDASQAGTGKVTCRIRSPSGSEIDIDIVENVDGTFSILFTPTFPGTYSINIKFGGQSIPEGEYTIQVGDDLITADTVDSVQSAPPLGSGLFNPVDFCIHVGPIFNFVTAFVKMPSGKKAYPKIEDNRDGTVTIRYQPTETGLHELHLNYNNQPIKGSPYLFHVDAVNSGYVTAYGPGLSHGVVNEPSEFTIVTKDAGAGGLSLAIEGPSKTEIKCRDNEDGTCTVSYIPTAPGEYKITVKFSDKHISGSPFTAKIQPGEIKRRAQIGRSSEVSLKVTETDINSLTASIRSPSGQEEPCILKRLPNGHLGISFTPRETGEHLVNVYRDGIHIANSPFKITVRESELGNASKVKVYGKGLEKAMANEVNEFIVDTRDAGYGGLSLSIEGPSKADIECHDNEDGTCRVTYRPTEPGNYIINIKFADEHVPGSHFSVKVGGEPSSRITERITRHKEAADITHIGSQCELSLKIPGTSPFDMTASVTSPSGVTELCDVVALDDCHYSIKFVPKEMGPHTVSVKHKDMHIPGSPFEFTVGPLTGGGAHKVHAAGPGLEKGEVGHQCEFNIYTREGGAGGLSIAVEGPSKAEIDFEDRKDGTCGVSYVVTEPGEYTISVKFNDEHIADSPFRVPITPSIGDARKVSVSAFQQKGLSIGKPCAFVVNYNGARKGVLRAKVTTPSGLEEECLVQEIDDGEYAVRFIPHENGPHLVDVTFDGCQIPESPFRIQVGAVHADPGMVQAYGDGLKTGKTGQVCKFFVNTVNAGSGALAVTVEGPSKVKLECKECDEGYEFTYTPTAPGDYYITIKYAGTHIVGSPYKAKIEGQGQASVYQEQASVVVETVTKTSIMSKFAGLQAFQSDASKVTAEGHGLKKAFRNKQTAFTVDTSRAGNNILLIGMMGPKGPCEELTVKHSTSAPNQYKITYIVKERGNYMLSIKWGEEHIPGSPYCIVCE
ncbi:hypothetical protein ACJMK2_015452 [Sinanodonta woodiana]|uniref:Calponin-homology (CH) domain-containing protein n=1 Tax=Sinanodonta woodiana TaxID=1069815 RepID=A0ABD3UQM7_SINWO